MATERADIDEKIFKIREIISFLKKYSEDCERIFREDEILKDAILYKLYILNDRSLRLAEIVCKYRKAGYPDSYSGFIYRLGDVGVLEKEFAYKFADIAKFRNFLAHAYDDIDEQKICRIMMESLDDVEIFLQQIEAAI